ARRPGRVLQLRPRYRDGLEVDAGPRADPVAPCDLGPEIAGSRGEGAIALGLAVLPPGEDRQGVLPADEPGGARPPQESHAGGPSPRRPRLARGWGAPDRPLPGAVRPRRDQAQAGHRDGRGGAVGAEGPAEDLRDVL